MSKKERGIKRQRRRFLSAFFRAAFVLIFVMGFWLGMASSGHAAGALLFDGNDDFAVTTFDPSLTFEKLTLMLWVKPGTPDREAESSYVRAVNQLPPRNGFIKTSYSIFTLQPDKFDPKRWGFKFSNADGDWEIWSGSDFYMTDPDGWYHIAVTYDSTLDSTLLGAEGNNLYLYLNGVVAAQGRAEGALTDILSMWIGRLVHAINGAIGEIVAYRSALSEALINESMDCGPVSDDSRVFYWPLNEGSGNAVTDQSSGRILYLGDASNNTKYEPVWTLADYILDTDGDGFADACDNCPGIPNDQADQDGDGAGNLCDSCSNDGPGSDGGQCDYATVAVVGQVEGLVPNVTFTWGDPDPSVGTAPDAYMVPQDCDNTVFECRSPSGEVFRSRCQLPRGYMVTFNDNENGDGLPGGDLVLYQDGDSTTIQCDLLRRLPLEAFAEGAECRAIHIASTYDRDYDWATGTCLREPCIEPNADFPYGREFTGIVTSNSFTIAPTQVVPVNIKHTSFPNSINLSGGGVITVGIYTSGDFIATTVDPSTVRLGDRLAGVFSTCEPKQSEFRDLSDTLCKDTPDIGDPNDIGACNPDGRADLLLHFDEPCLPFTQDLEVTVKGQTFDGASILGFDNLIVR